MTPELMTLLAPYAVALDYCKEQEFVVPVLVYAAMVDLTLGNSGDNFYWRSTFGANVKIVPDSEKSQDRSEHVL